MAAKQNKIDTSHKQYGSTCLLSSFAVVGNYFTKTPIHNFFNAYYNIHSQFFQIHGIRFLWPQFGYCQGVYINHFGRQHNLSGYQILCDLHLKSNQKAFQTCRNKFNCENVKIKKGVISKGTFGGKKINEFLECQEKETIINIFLGMKNDSTDKHDLKDFEMHSITVYYDNGFFYHDTNNPTDDKQNILLNNWWDYNRIDECLIYWKK